MTPPSAWTGSGNSLDGTGLVSVSHRPGRPSVHRNGSHAHYYQEILDECTFRILAKNVPKAKGYLVVIGRGRAQPFTLASVVATSGLLTYDANASLITQGLPQ